MWQPKMAAPETSPGLGIFNEMTDTKAWPYFGSEPASPKVSCWVSSTLSLQPGRIEYYSFSSHLFVLSILALYFSAWSSELLRIAKRLERLIYFPYEVTTSSTNVVKGKKTGALEVSGSHFRLKGMRRHEITDLGHPPTLAEVHSVCCTSSLGVTSIIV
jgi:hypothetical protein